MVSMVMVVLAASPFVATDGGFSSVSRTAVPHRTLEVFAPSSLGAPVVVSDGDAPGTHVDLRLDGTDQASLEAGGTLLYPSETVRLSHPDPLTLRIERAGPITVRLPPIAGVDGNRLSVQRDTARFVVTASSPFVAQANGTWRIDGAATWLTVQLMPIAGFMPWPTLGVPGYGANIVWDEARARLTRFGGTDDVAYQAATFIWDDVQGWVDLQIPSPPPRLRAGMTYDRIRQRIVLFGGQASEAMRLNDTWEFDGAQWTQLQPPTSPSPRWAHGLVYDPVARKTVLFGGITESSTGELADTWTWDGTQWTELYPLSRPTPRDAFGMAWDNANQRVVLAGGWDGVQPLTETWSWDGTSWTRLADYFGTPRTSTAMAFNPLTQELVLAGGNEPRGGIRFFDDVDVLGLSGWRTDSRLPQKLDRVALASHPVHGVVLVGGRSPRVSDETLRMSPSWESMSQGRRDEGRVAVWSDRVIGKGAIWFAESGHWKRERASVAPPLRALTTNPGGHVVVSGASDGGWFAWLSSSGAQIEAPPFGSTLGGQSGWAWAVDGAGKLRRFDGTTWLPVADVPSGLRVLEWGAFPEVLATRGPALVAWDVMTGSERLVTDALPLDGGEHLSLGRGPISVVTAEGTWHAVGDGGWDLLSLPAVPDRLEFNAYLTDAGLGRYEVLKPRGARCDSATECQSNSCRDGRCCEGSCSGVCEVCSVAAGAVQDGVCSPAPATRECLRDGCMVSRCVASLATCGPSVCEPEEMDAGEPVVVEPTPDAGSRPVRDAGTTPEEPSPVAPSGCQCGTPAGLDASMLLLGLLALRRRAREG